MVLRDFPTITTAICLGIGMMLIYTAVNPMKMIYGNYLADVNGCIALAIVFSTQALGNFFAPVIIQHIPPKNSLILSSMVYIACSVCLFWPIPILMYVVSACLGMAASVMWACQNMIVKEISHVLVEETVLGWFLTVYWLSLLVGHISIYFIIGENAEYNEHSRKIITIVFVVVVISGFMALAEVPQVEFGEPIEVMFNVNDYVAFVSGVNFPLLSVMYFVSGLNLTFFSGIYGNCIGYSDVLGKSAKRSVTLSGALSGVGQVLGSSFFGQTFGQYLTHKTSYLVIGCIVNVIAYTLILLNIPSEAPFGYTDDKPITGGSMVLALLCSFLLGFGDSAVTVHLYSFSNEHYDMDYPAAYAMFKCVQCIGQGVGFICGRHIALTIQMYIMIGLSLVGTILFGMVNTYSFG